MLYEAEMDNEVVIPLNLKYPRIDMTSSYTVKMEDSVWAQYDVYEEDGDDSSVIDFLNQEGAFRSFGEGLLCLLKKKGIEFPSEESVHIYIAQQCKKNGIKSEEVASVNTLKSWFRGGPRPKKGEDSRESLFALAFALKFTVEEAAELFNKVYLDRAFDFRNEREVIYFYCLSNNLSWSDAKRLIDQAQGLGTVKEGTVPTMLIMADVASIKKEKDLLKYIKEHKYNFSQSSVTAKSHLERLINKAKVVASNEVKYHVEDAIHTNKWRHEDNVSINFMMSVITGVSPSTSRGTTTIFRNARLPREIKNRFPEAAAFSEKEPTYESLRKMIILLHSYIHWYGVQWEEKESDFDDYVESINYVLTECGFSTLYYGNPYDWLFMYCSISERPLDIFRDILTDVLD